MSKKHWRWREGKAEEVLDAGAKRANANIEPKNTLPAWINPDYRAQSRLPMCEHEGLSVILTIGDTTFGGATKSDIVLHQADLRLVVSFAGPLAKNDCEPWHLPKAFAKLAQFRLQPCESLVIPWEDRGTPPVQAGFWPYLLHLLPAGHVVCCCLGGHGRTGTALAALAIAGLRMDAKAAIEHVRSRYCPQAIESKVQEDYLYRLARQLAN